MGSDLFASFKTGCKPHSQWEFDTCGCLRRKCDDLVRLDGQTSWIKLNDNNQQFLLKKSDSKLTTKMKKLTCLWWLQTRIRLQIPEHPRRYGHSPLRWDPSLLAQTALQSDPCPQLYPQKFQSTSMFLSWLTCNHKKRLKSAKQVQPHTQEFLPAQTWPIHCFLSIWRVETWCK